MRNVSPIRFGPIQTVISVVVFFLVIITIVVLMRFWVSVPAGHRGVATLFGQVQPVPFKEGLHIPINPLYNFTYFDVRKNTHMETASVPSQDQLQTKIEVSVQYRLDGDMTPLILKNTGDVKRAVSVHLVPKVRSMLREQGKSIARAEDFFREETQVRLQDSLETGLREYLDQNGIIVEAVLIRDITLPNFITKAIEKKKEREQQVEEQKAELERFKTEQEQLIAAAEAERRAAEEQAAMQMVLADARAYEIKKINDAIAENQAYIQLQALETLKSISSDPAAKLYFLDSNSPMPLPLMHMGEGLNIKPAQR